MGEAASGDANDADERGTGTATSNVVVPTCLMKVRRVVGISASLARLATNTNHGSKTGVFLMTSFGPLVSAPPIVGSKLEKVDRDRT